MAIKSHTAAFSLLLALLFGQTVSAFEYAAPIEFNHIDLANFSDDQSNVGSITTITQDAKGFMWIGGENGLARYDGHSVLLYRAGISGLSGTYVQNIVSDGDKYLWVATTAGISRFNYSLGTFDNITEASGKIPGNEVASVALYKDWLLAGTTEGLAVLDRETLASVQPSFMNRLPKKIHIRALYIFNNILWVGTSNKGLIEVNLLTDETTYYRPKPGNPFAIPASEIRGIHTFDGNRIWLASLGGGFIEFDKAKRQFTQYAALTTANKPFITNDVFSISGDSQGNIWIGTDNSGLWRFTPSTQKLEGFVHDNAAPYGIGSDKTRFIFEDNNHNIWVGSFSGVLEYHHQRLDQFTRFYERNRAAPGLNHSSVLSILEAEDNRFWVGTEGGLDLVDPLQGSIKHYQQKTDPTQGLIANPILAIEKDEQGNLYLGTWGGGLQKFNPKTEEWMALMHHPDPQQKLENPYIWSLKKDHRGNLWVGSQTRGIYRIQLATGEVFRYPYNGSVEGAIPGEMIPSMALDNQGNIWISSLHGAARYRPQTDDFESFTFDPANPHSLSSNQTTSVIARNNGEVWIGTRATGINIYDANAQQFKHLGAQDGLISSEITSLIEDSQNNVWAATPSGVYRIDNITHQVRLFKQANGLAGTNHNRNASALDKNGKIWIGSKSGLSIFDPEAIKNTPPANKTVISGVSINYGSKYGPHYWGSNRQLPAPLKDDQNAISIDFSLNQFYFPQMNEYRYRLRGLSDQWQSIIRFNTATYTNLDPGYYVFEVQGKSADSDWNNNVTQLSFYITAPLWKQWWAYILYAILAYLLFVAYRNYLAIKERSVVFQQLSQKDSLTELPNRLALNNTVEDWIAHNIGFGLIVLDLDFFKKINDNYGHATGDEILKAFAKMVKTLCREIDIIGRWGGEEFLMLCKGADLNATLNIATRIQSTVASQPFMNNGKELTITISAGCAVRYKNETFNNLFQRADNAMYLAKSSGRNCVKAG